MNRRNIITVILAPYILFGLYIIYEGSNSLTSNRFYYLEHAMLWDIFGIFLLFVVSRINYKFFVRISTYLLIFLIFAIIFTIFKGQSINGATRWIVVKGITIQPSEFIKPVIILYFAGILEKGRTVGGNVLSKLTIPFTSILLLVSLLTLYQKDLGTTIIIIIISISIYFLYIERPKQLYQLLLILSIFLALAVVAIIIEPYRLERILTYSSSQTSNSLGSGYQLKQILITIGSGGLFGKGIGYNIGKTPFLVQGTSITDSAFAIIAQELGFFLTTLFLIYFIAIISLLYYIALTIKDYQGKAIFITIVILIFFQSIINIFVNLNILPLTGIPLPLISYGGSSTISIFLSLGLIYSIIYFDDKEKDTSDRRSLYKRTKHS